MDLVSIVERMGRLDPARSVPVVLGGDGVVLDVGRTDLAELIPACSRHHHLAHEGGWSLTLDPVTRELTVRLPDGTLHRRSRPDSVAAPTAGRAA